MNKLCPNCLLNPELSPTVLTISSVQVYFCKVKKPVLGSLLDTFLSQKEDGIKMLIFLLCLPHSDSCVLVCRRDWEDEGVGGQGMVNLGHHRVCLPVMLYKLFRPEAEGMQMQQVVLMSTASCTGKKQAFVPTQFFALTKAICT